MIALDLFYNQCYCMTLKKKHYKLKLIEELRLAGWGLLSGGGAQANVLQQGELPVVSNEDCAKKYTRYDSEAHLCAGRGLESGSGGCQGDSGGPLVCEKYGTWYLHGAVSFGKRGCPTTAYTVFTRITTYVPWINDKIGASTFIYLTY